MHKITGKVFIDDARFVSGLLLMLAGLLSGAWIIWHLNVKGDIIVIIHEIKMGLPGWAWLILKHGLSFAFGMAYLAVFVLAGMIIIGWGRRR